MKYTKRFNEGNGEDNVKNISELLADIELKVKISFYGHLGDMKKAFKKVDSFTETEPFTIKGTVTIGALQKIENLYLSNIESIKKI